MVTLIGATTENPSFEVIRPLLSRCQLYVLKSLEKDDLLELLHHALEKDAVLKEKHIELKETDAMLRYSGGDARKLLNILELVVEADDSDPIVITDGKVVERLQQNPLAYDKDGEMHYDIISAFIKSIRGSDPDGALYWLARMVEGGRRPSLHCPQAGDIGFGRHRAGKPECVVACQCSIRCRNEDWLARRAHSAGRSHRLSGYQSQEQFGIYGHQ